jgi:hypothetical protein
MPSWVKDEEKWAKAKEIAEREYDIGEDNPDFYRIVTGIYKKMMGGKLAKAVPVLFIKADYSEHYRKLLARRTDGSPEAMAREDGKLGTKLKEMFGLDELIKHRKGGYRKEWNEAWRKIKQSSHKVYDLEDEDAYQAMQPSPGDLVEFLSDRQSDKGPATGTVEELDGDSVHVRVSDGSQWLDWPSVRIQKKTTVKDGRTLWMLKAQPTDAQIEAGNYKKEHRRFRGLDISIENPKGSTRSGTDPNGHKWSVKMRADYGYIKRTMGVDGDQVDVFLGSDEESPWAFIITTMAPPDFKKKDEQKVMLCYPSKEEAKEAFYNHYDDPRFFGDIQQMDFEEFKRKVMTTMDNTRMIKAIPVLFFLGRVQEAIRV